MANPACDRVDTLILEKIYYPEIYPLRFSILHNFHSIHSLLSLCLSLWIFIVAPLSFSSSSSFVLSSSLPTRLTFDIFQTYKLLDNNPPTFILLQPRGSPFSLCDMKFEIVKLSYSNVFISMGSQPYIWLIVFY